MSLAASRRRSVKWRQSLLFLYIILGAMIVLTLSVSVLAFYMLRERRIVVAKNRELLRMKNDGESIPLVVEKRRDPQQEELFVTIDTAIRQERLYADVALQRQDVCDRFGINRHALNEPAGSLCRRAVVSPVCERHSSAGGTAAVA